MLFSKSKYAYVKKRDKHPGIMPGQVVPPQVVGEHQHDVWGGGGGGEQEGEQEEGEESHPWSTAPVRPYLCLLS